MTIELHEWEPIGNNGSVLSLGKRVAIRVALSAQLFALEISPLPSDQ